jgi:hypothetical protein
MLRRPKSSYPTSPDGVYWIAPAALALPSLRDMAISAELCTRIEGEHRGGHATRLLIAYLMKSILLSSDGTCRIWALRGAEGYPLTFLRPVNGVSEAATCPALGFVADGVLGNCPYGAQFGDCGFGTSPLHLWGNYCAGCAVNDGAYDRYVLQGPIDTGIVLSSVQGNVFTTCRVR